MKLLLLMAIITLSSLSALAIPPGFHIQDRGDEIPSAERKFLVSAEKKLTVSADELKTQFAQLSFAIKNGYTAYRITYNTTDAKGKAVIASGAVFVPDTKSPMPLLNYNHGTIFPSQEYQAPSYLKNNAEAGIGKLFSSAGYIVVMPDYVGYGSSKKSPHPYGAYHLIAQSVTDMLYATREFCAEEKLVLNGKNFFSGWSEGAAVGLAVVQKLEQGNDKNFVPTSSVLNAGPYFSSAFIDKILESDKPLRYMPTYVWVLRSYNWIYNINKPYSYYFKEPAATALTKDEEAEITRDPNELFTPQFKQDYLSGQDSLLKKALIANDLWNWKPTSKIIFCHGDKDDYVPIFNSEKAYTEMKAKGANVELRVFKGQSHTSGVFGFLQTTFGEFQSKR